MDNATLSKFLGPVKAVHRQYTELEDGGIYISPEQLIEIGKQGKVNDRALDGYIERAKGYMDIDLSKLDKAIEEHIQKSFGNWGWINLGFSSRRIMQSAFFLGALWGAYLAREKDAAKNRGKV